MQAVGHPLPPGQRKDADPARAAFGAGAAPPACWGALAVRAHPAPPVAPARATRAGAMREEATLSVSWRSARPLNRGSPVWISGLPVSGLDIFHHARSVRPLNRRSPARAMRAGNAHGPRAALLQPAGACAHCVMRTGDPRPRAARRARRRQGRENKPTNVSVHKKNRRFSFQEIGARRRQRLETAAFSICQRAVSAPRQRLERAAFARRWRSGVRRRHGGRCARRGSPARPT